jgi:hypothetical protein
MQQVFRALLMLGLLPGFLVPGGWALRLCLCQGLFPSQREAAPSCCEEVEPEASCCTGSCPCAADRTPDAPAGPGARKHERCGCILISAPDQPPVRLPSGAADAGAPLALPAPPLPAAARRPACVLGSREAGDLLPEPPGKRRNLPLLI